MQNFATLALALCLGTSSAHRIGGGGQDVCTGLRDFALGVSQTYLNLIADAINGPDDHQCLSDDLIEADFYAKDAVLFTNTDNEMPESLGVIRGHDEIRDYFDLWCEELVAEYPNGPYGFTYEASFDWYDCASKDKTSNSIYGIRVTKSFINGIQTGETKTRFSYGVVRKKEKGPWIIMIDHHSTPVPIEIFPDEIRRRLFGESG